MQLTIAQDVVALQGVLASLASQGKRIAFVPTMGALHAGHATLISEARKRAGSVVVSIFVNPMQFDRADDFQRYPRTLQDDYAKAQQAGADIVYAPQVEDIYPRGFGTVVSAGEMGKILCGAHRPGHFDGVATVVTKLLLRVLPHAALFGEKDYQQLCVIRRVVRDLDMPIEIVGVPTVRETDGLALSSRNVHLSADERKRAPHLYRVLSETAQKIKEGKGEALQEGIMALTQNGFKVDYLELRSADTLAPLSRPEPGSRLLAAAWLGNTRLIDNIVVA